MALSARDCCTMLHQPILNTIHVTHYFDCYSSQERGKNIRASIEIWINRSVTVREIILTDSESTDGTFELLMRDRLYRFRNTFGQRLPIRRAVQDYLAEKKGIDCVVEWHDRCNGRPFKVEAGRF